MRRYTVYLLATLWVMPSLRAAEVDRTDARAVGEEYLRRMAAGERDAAYELAVEDKAMRNLATMAVGSADAQLEAWMTAASLLGAVKDTPPFTVGETLEGDGEMVLPLTATYTREAALVLKKMDNGQYAVDVRATVLKSIKDEQARAVFEQQIKQFERPEMAAMTQEQPDNYKVYQAQGNMWEVARALSAFAAERGGYPEAAIWMDELLPYLDNDEKRFADTVHLDEQYSFAFNAELGGKPRETDWQKGQQIPLLASVSGNLPNATFVPADLAKQAPRYGTINVVMMVNENQMYLGEGETPADVAEAETQSDAAQKQLRALHKAAKAYADQHGGVLPDADQWTDQIQPLIDVKDLPNGSALASPFVEDTRCAYAINQEIAGKSMKSLINHRKLMLFIEVEPGPPNRAVKPGDPGPAWHRQRWQPGSNKVRYAVYLNGDTRGSDEG